MKPCAMTMDPNRKEKKIGFIAFVLKEYYCFSSKSTQDKGNPTFSQIYIVYTIKTE